LAGELGILTLDHHLMRSEKEGWWSDCVSSLSEHKVIYAADFMGHGRSLLEAERVLCYRKALIPKGWHKKPVLGVKWTRRSI